MGLDWPSDGDRLSRVDRAPQVPPLEHADLKPHATLGALLALPRVGVHEVQVADHDTDRLEPEDVQHRRLLSAAKPR